MTFTNFALSS